MSNPAPPRNFPLKAAVFEGGLALLALVLGAILGVNPMRTLSGSAAAIGWGVIATLPPLAGVAVLIWLPWRRLRRMIDLVDRTIVPAFRPCGLAELGIISLLAGLGEELLFRGAIQEAAAQAFTGPAAPWLGLLLASALFGMAHFITPLYALLAGLMGVYLGALWLWSGNLMVPIVTHAMYDFLVLVYLVKFRRAPSDAPPLEDRDVGQTQS
jgi:membrane protease YdiL (CAAX protease family)